ncbi:DUF2190 family protein [Maridesulfovibrio ferrireducens]|uniref:DUF2190 family protein n=1 Tax=Maridesulfovibrio ferrireducens TaxID=246191 RepID=UPI001A303AC2|nr:DUF2190 family protein [Maridesulfovibrio ferrireducens]MBI9109995.1 DUF2190 family protein [Maridesulfovibrio ferrireducens]
MAQNHICKGKVLDWTNGTGSDVLSGQAVVVGSIFAVALGDIADGESGVLSISEVYALPKAAEALTQGAKVYWDVDGDPKNGVVGSGALTATALNNVYTGVVMNAAVADAETVNVKINA